MGKARNGLILLSALVLVGCAQGEANPTTSSTASPLYTTVATSTPMSTIPTDYTQPAKVFVSYLIEQKYHECTSYFSPTLLEAIPADMLKQVWNKVTAGCGNFVSVSDTEANGQNVEVFIQFEQNTLICKITFGDDGMMEGLFFSYKDDAVLKEGLEEMPVTIGADGEYPLNGKLTKRQGIKSDCAVLLVHGSGPSDMDETIAQNKPFRDIAWGLAEKGVDVLRYDKRTFSYASKLVSIDQKDFSVQEEVIDDALLAAELLEQQGYKKIFLAGHSLGGMLALPIEAQSPSSFTGLISLAGTPRKLTDLIIDQNKDAIETIEDESVKNQALAQLETEILKLDEMQKLTEKEWLNETVFGIPAYYLMNLNSIDVPTMAKAYKKPIFVLQGEGDFQVFADTDYPLWKEVLKDNPAAKFKLYDGLSHLFMPVQEEGRGTIEEYNVPSHVDSKVISDIASFVTSQ